ncbi:hypothetical protein QN348_16465 [Mucilaginibacter sp. 5C4]|nr:hypothetical protein [Mucilaginibacter sp. 10B2]MEB0263020.1 hypothetical protein [Mucilaginibacter sp. 10I4]MEB0279671.1 hypothetical protein [Mucilaginibacter sp. 10B2]MEB0302477.1 hypothetical protein [Mucilaginibacter sp. 5C4]
MITIRANRSSKIDLNKIFYNHSSSIYKQIIKTLISYYSHSGKFTALSVIEISRKRANKTLDKKILGDKEFQQILDKSFKLNYTIDVVSLNEMLDKSEKSHVLLLSISFLLKANSIDIPSLRFERLWKAFNVLYRFIGQKSTESDCLRELRVFILQNHIRFPLSSGFVSPITKLNLRSSIRWRDMILNDFDTEAKTRHLNDFILRYTDVRIMQIVKETNFLYREDFLKRGNFFNSVEAHVDGHISSNTKNDVELVSVLALKYMYYLRNKTFHGERIDSEFRLLVNKEIKEFEFLNKVLEILVIDLINCSDLY